MEIHPSNTQHHLGDTLDLECRGAEPGANVHWSKQGGRLAHNVHQSGPTLRIISLRPENAGVYRCEVSSHNVDRHQTYEVRLIGM